MIRSSLCSLSAIVIIEKRGRHVMAVSSPGSLRGSKEALSFRWPVVTLVDNQFVVSLPVSPPNERRSTPQTWLQFRTCNALKERPRQRYQYATGRQQSPRDLQGQHAATLAT
jgi:hypothetical protein